MECKVKTITPLDAAHILEKNKVNRMLSIGRVNQYAYDIKNGLWQLNGESIKSAPGKSAKILAVVYIPF